MAYIPKKDRNSIKLIERCINEVTGQDKDSYLDTRRMNRANRVLRYTWIYEVYNLTLLSVTDISEMIDRNQSNVTRALQEVKRWKSKKTKEYYHFIEIHNKITNEIIKQIIHEPTAKAV